VPPLNSAVGRQTSFQRQLDPKHHELQPPSRSQDTEVPALGLSGVGTCLAFQNSESLQNALRHDQRNMSERIAHSFEEKSLSISLQELHIEGCGKVQELSTGVTYMAVIDRDELRLVGLVQKRCACIRQDRETAHPGHCRPTNRCSGPGRIKCLAAGGQALSFCGRWRARVLQRPRPAAELSRYTARVVERDESNKTGPPG